MATKVTPTKTSFLLSAFLARRAASPARVRETLESLGPTFIKVGQFLSLRPDLIPQEYCDELMQLLDVVPPEPFSEARRILAQDLGDDPERLFAWINPDPIGAASLAQVYQARTHDGYEVAVKVQRARVAEQIRRDLRRVRLLSRILEQSGLTPEVSPNEVVQELARWLAEELDFRRELRNVTRLYELAHARDPLGGRIPRPLPELSGGRVLTTELLVGVPLSEFLRLARAGRADRMSQLGFDSQVLAENVLTAVLHQIFRYQIFQADTHPGNLIALSGNLIGFVDFGLVDTLDPSFSEGMLRYLRAAYLGDIQGVLRGLMEILIPGDGADPDRFRADFLKEARRWQRELFAQPDAGEDDQSPVARYLVGVMRAARRNRMQVPAGVLSMYRALLTAETVARQLGGKVNLTSVGRRFFDELEIESRARLLDPEYLQARVVELVEVLRTGPGNIQRVLSDLAEDRFVLRVDTSESAETRRRANLRARLVGVAILSVGLAVLAVGAPQIALGGLPLSAISLVALAGVYVWFFSHWRGLR